MGLYMMRAFGNFLIFVATFWDTLRWYVALFSVERTQKKILMDLIHKNANTDFGKNFHFSEINSPREFAQRVPVTTYEDYESFIKEVRQGKESVLTSSRISLLQPTSGTTGGTKLIPYTQQLMRGFQKGINPWIFHLFMLNPHLFFGASYWSITPVASKTSEEEKIPIGFDDDSEYLPGFVRPLIEATFVVPAELAKVTDFKSWKFLTLFFLLREENLRLISIWNPTFLSVLLDDLPRFKVELLHSLKFGALPDFVEIDEEINRTLKGCLKKHPQRAVQVERAFVRFERDGNEAAFYQHLWPNLVLVSTWANGFAEKEAKKLALRFPDVKFQPKGLLATECFVTFPLKTTDHSALSIQSHFFEFQDQATGRICVVSEVQVGERYSIIVTTGGGLYRYALGDVVEVTGKFFSCPLLRFIGRAGGVVDHFGEKLETNFVVKIVEKELNELNLTSSFWMLSLDRSEEGAAYALFLDRVPKAEDIQQLKVKIDSGLQQNYHYAHCRTVGQLRALRIFVIEGDAQAMFLEGSVKLGKRLGDIKFTHLHSFDKWRSFFKGTFV